MANFITFNVILLKLSIKKPVLANLEILSQRINHEHEPDTSKERKKYICSTLYIILEKSLYIICVYVVYRYVLYSTSLYKVFIVY